MQRARTSPRSNGLHRLTRRAELHTTAGRLRGSCRVHQQAVIDDTPTCDHSPERKRPGHAVERICRHAFLRPLAEAEAARACGCLSFTSTRPRGSATYGRAHGMRLPECHECLATPIGNIGSAEGMRLHEFHERSATSIGNIGNAEGMRLHEFADALSSGNSPRREHLGHVVARVARCSLPSAVRTMPRRGSPAAPRSPFLPMGRWLNHFQR